jgi:hypothetical protein
MQLMVLVPPDAANVVPGIRCVAEVALLDRSMLLAGDFPRYHTEMPHIMAGRRLVTLGTVGRVGRRMAESCDRPTQDPVTRGAALFEEPAMRIVV